MGNLIGEPFEPYVNSQIDARQQIYGKKSNRTSEEIAYLNSNNGWVKLASGVEINDQRLSLLKAKNNQMLNSISTGKQLAMEYVLFNSITSYSESTDKDGNKKYSQNQYQGVGKGGRVAYGVDGTDFGYSPMPGLIDVDIKDLNRGSIKKATLSIKVFNRNQLEVIDCLYMRLGYTVLLEWGHSKYWDDVQKQLINQPASLIDTAFFNDQFNDSDYTKFIPLIEEHRKKTRGNYDAMFGTVSNFSWTFEPDGSYNCKIEIISLGDIVESLGISVSTGEGTNEKLGKLKLQSTQFIKNEANLNQFYAILYPGLEEALQTFYNSVQLDLKKGNIDIVNRIYNSRFRTLGEVLPPLPTIGFNYLFQENPLDLTEENKELVNKKQKNIDKFFGKVKEGTNFQSRIWKILGTYYIKAIQTYFKNLQEKKKYLFLKIDNNQQVDFFIEREIPEENKPYDWKYITDTGLIDNTEATSSINGADALVENDVSDNGYDPKRLSGDLILSGYEGSNNPDLDLINRVPLGFVNLATRNTPNSLKDTNDIVEGESQTFKLTPLQKSILSKCRIDDFSLFKGFIYDEMKRYDLAGGEDDPAFEEAAEAAEAEENEEEAGKKELLEFTRIAEEKSLRGNFFKYFYKIKSFYEPDTDSSNEAKDGVIDYWADKDLVTFPTLETRPVIKNNFQDGEGDLAVGNTINPYLENDDELVKKWNKEVGYPIYKKTQSTSGDTLYFPYSNKGEILGTANTDFVRLNVTNVDKSFYIQFGKLLAYLRDVNITCIDTDGKPPMIGIDVDEGENVCYAIDSQYSLDPRKVIIRNDNIYINDDKTGKLYEGLRNFINNSKEGTYGNLMNVYVNFYRIEELLTKLSDKRGEVKLFDFIQSICDDINECLGGVNNLEVTVNDKQKLVIRDQTPIPNAKNLFPDKFSAIDQQTPLEVFGYNNNKASFVTNVGFTTKISKDFATMITIGATSKGSVPGTEASAFSKWNIGITDRFKNNLTSPDSPDSSNLSPIEQLKEENKSVIDNYATNSLLGLQSQGFTENKKGNFTYLTFNDEFIKNNSKIVKEFYKYAQAEVTLSEDPEDKGIVESSIGFIPFNLSIDMEGMSGFKIYNRLKVNTNFLPTNYEETLDFIITGVNHKISSNQWKTSLATLATSKSVLTK